jgi:hypothetical protein
MPTAERSPASPSNTHLQKWPGCFSHCPRFQLCYKGRHYLVFPLCYPLKKALVKPYIYSTHQGRSCYSQFHRWKSKPQAISSFLMDYKVGLTDCKHEYFYSILLSLWEKGSSCQKLPANHARSQLLLPWSICPWPMEMAQLWQHQASSDPEKCCLGVSPLCTTSSSI